MVTDYIVILGSGESINLLTEEQRKKINNCSVKIGINKYAGFFKKSKIVPTHIYFHDAYDKSAILMFKYIISVLYENNIENLTFITDPLYKTFLTTDKDFYIARTITRKKIFNFCKSIQNYNNRFLLKIFPKVSKRIDRYLKNKYLNDIYYNENQSIKYNLLPKGSITEYINITINEWNKRGNEWAKSLGEPLYHFRGSFSTVLNYISIKYPNKPILLVGVDFNSSKYFFQEELDRLDFVTSDWTTPIVKEQKKHFSIIDYEGTKMDDEMPFMINELSKTNNNLYSINPNSFLVENGFAKNIEI